MNHALKMILGCVLPLLLIFLLPLLGVSEETTLFLVIVAFFIGHLLMMGGHAGHGGTRREAVPVPVEEEREDSRHVHS